MKRLVIVLALFGLVVSLSACGEEVVTSVMSSEDATATAQSAYAMVPEDVPIKEGAHSLQVTANSTYISYLVLGTLDELTVYYQEQMAALGWETQNPNERGFGDSITIMRYKPEKNVSVTLQTIAASDEIRVLITVIPK